MKLKCVAEDCIWESQDLNEGLAKDSLLMHLRLVHQIVPAQPQVGGTGVCVKLDLLQLKMLLQLVDHGHSVKDVKDSEALDKIDEIDVSEIDINKRNSETNVFDITK